MNSVVQNKSGRRRWSRNAPSPPRKKLPKSARVRGSPSAGGGTLSSESARCGTGIGVDAARKGVLATTEGTTELGDTICSVCWAPATEPVTTPCAHTFCQECIGYWLCVQNSRRCPLYRTRLGAFARSIPLQATPPVAFNAEKRGQLRMAHDDDQEGTGRTNSPPLAASGARTHPQQQTEGDEELARRLQRAWNAE